MSVKKKWLKNYVDRWLLLIYLSLLTLGLNSCIEKNRARQVDRSFYYWKSTVQLTAFELNRLDSLHAKTIYLKLFDVDMESSTALPVPKAKLQVRDKHLFSGYHIIPTVFITNACFQKIDSSQTILLADKIHQLIKDICEINQLNNIDEIQVDCDWTAGTRNKYFSLLQRIKELSNTNISATIRLHQVKFMATSGVPPVGRGLLMCYNMGNLKSPATKNSIIETSELKKYTANLSSYPLPLDVALPLFEWKVLFRNNVYHGLLENIDENIFTKSFTRKNNNLTEILADTLLAGYDLKKGDLLRSEKSDANEIMAAANEINKHLDNTRMRVSFYHLDSVTLNKFTTNELEEIYNIFN
ncbi:MAG: hypothetical protein ABIQ31_01575 [Ferruginibacter sp.]